MRCGCQGVACGCTLVAGSNVTISGVGTSGNPFIVSAAATGLSVLDTATVNLTLLGAQVSAAVKLDPTSGNLIVATANGIRVDCAAVVACLTSAGTTTVADTSTVDMTITGAGTGGSPYVISSAVKLSPTPGNLLTADSGGVFLDCATVAACTTGLMLNVKDFGAIGNGIADDTAAIQATIDAIPTAGGLVYAPWGTYKLTSALNVRSHLQILGDGDASTIFYQTNTAANGLNGVDIDRLTLSQLQILGPGSGTGIGINLTRSVHAATLYLDFHDLYVPSWGSDGIALSNAIVSTFSRVVSESNGGHGFNIYGVPAGAAGTSCTFDSCYGNGNLKAGFRIFNMVYCSFNSCAADSNGIGYLFDSSQGCTLSACGIESGVNRGVSYPGTGFKITGGYGIALLNCWVYDNPEVGVYVTGTAHTITLGGVVDNTPHGGAVNFIKVDAGSGVTMWSCSNTTANSIAIGTTQLLDDGNGAMELRGYLYGASTAAFEHDMTSLGGNFITSFAGKGLQVKEGADAKMGVGTLVAGAATVTNGNVTATSRIFLTINEPGGTPGALYVSARTVSSGFTVLSTSGTDTSTFAFFIVEPTP